MTDYQKYLQNEYSERHRFWADKTLTQFGFSNNFFLAVAIGILGFVLKEIELNAHVSFSLSSINWRITLSRVSAFLAFFSIIFGTATMLSRLFDLRLTRHINTIRMKAYTKDFGFRTMKNNYVSIKGKRRIDYLKNFYNTLVSIDYYLTDSDIIDKKKCKKKFKSLRERTLLLGRFSWWTFYAQMIILLLSVFVFIIGWMI